MTATTVVTVTASVAPNASNTIVNQLSTSTDLTLVSYVWHFLSSLIAM